MECTRARAAAHLRVSRFARRTTEKRETARSLHLGEHLFYHTDNLSKDLQGTKMTAVSGQRLANLTKGTLTKIRIDQSFDHFYANVARKSESVLGEPTLLRKRHTSARLEVGAGTRSYPQTARDHFVRAYYEAIDLIVRAIYQRVNQESFSF